ncbi:hypothetical protein QFZ51_001735 [Chitinophaga sp. W3I9]|uniref:hypothetical protein n=1 Tax=unclassified Chitinophaga TaxID=2619133 RepID=UPI003D20050B
MNRKSLLIGCMLYFASASITASAQKGVEYILPAASFDEAATNKLLEPGTATIRGNAFLKKKGKVNFATKGHNIILFPVTPYFTEFLELKKKYNKGKKQASMTNDAFTYRIEGRYLDDQGNFEFTELKPGKYYLVTWIEYERKKNLILRTGTRTFYNVYSGNEVRSEPIYNAYSYYYQAEDEVAGFVEVNKEGEVVNTVISN